MSDENAIPKTLRYECNSPACAGMKRDHNVVLRTDGEYRTCLACGCKTTWRPGLGGRLTCVETKWKESWRDAEDAKRDVDYKRGRPKGATDVQRRKRRGGG